MMGAVGLATPARADSFAFFLGLPGFTIFAADPPPAPGIYQYRSYHPGPLYLHEHRGHRRGWVKQGRHRGHHGKCRHGHDDD
jgi:hypothetical protein